VISQEKLRNNRTLRGGPAVLRFSSTSVGAPSPVQTAAGTVHPCLVQRRGGARKIRASARACDHKRPGLLPDEAGETQAKARVIAVTATTPVTHLIVPQSVLNRRRTTKLTEAADARIRNTEIGAPGRHPLRVPSLGRWAGR
jgi:hypothetical protein